MKLPALVTLRRINAHIALVAAGARVIVHAPFARVSSRRREVAEVDALVRLDVIQVRRLQAAHAFGIGVVQYPLVVVQVSQVPAVIEHAMADLFDDA